MNINWDLFGTLYLSLFALQITKELYGFGMYKWMTHKEKKRVAESVAGMFGVEEAYPGVSVTLPFPFPGGPGGNYTIATVSGGDDKREVGQYL